MNISAILKIHPLVFFFTNFQISYIRVKKIKCHQNVYSMLIHESFISSLCGLSATAFPNG